jgi:sugar lactone lactonase YvrE
MTIYDARRCALGEGFLWHPERAQPFWFDILGFRLLSRDGDRELAWDFGEHVSAAGWVDRETLIVASETGLWRFGIESGAREFLGHLTPDAPHLRSNDGRADPWGGFWIGTMGKRAEAKAGGIWRYYRGELRAVVPALSIPNALSFDASREIGYFADTAVGTVWSVPLDPASGWPKDEPRVFLDLAAEGLSPDGAVVDADGRFWSAQWGAGQVACYAPDGRFVHAERFPAPQLTCPGFGGASLRTLYVTSAREGMSAEALAAAPAAGATFAREVEARGLPEPRVVLG